MWREGEVVGTGNKVRVLSVGEELKPGTQVDLLYDEVSRIDRCLSAIRRVKAGVQKTAGSVTICDETDPDRAFLNITNEGHRIALAALVGFTEPGTGQFNLRENVDGPVKNQRVYRLSIFSEKGDARKAVLWFD